MTTSLYCDPLRAEAAARRSLYEMNRGVDVVSAAFGGRKMACLRVGYKGTASGTVTVAAGGDITFKVGTAGSEAADTSVGLPTKNGIFDVSDAGADTIAEIIADLNASDNWYALPASVPPTYISNNTFATLSETTVPHVNDGGLLLEADYAEIDIFLASNFVLCRGLGLEDARDITLGMYDRATYPTNATPRRYMHKQVLENLSLNITGAGQDATNTVLEIIGFQDGVWTTATTLWSQTGWTTATEKKVPSDDSRGPILIGQPGQNLFLVARTTDNTTPDPAIINLAGFVDSRAAFR